MLTPALLAHQRTSGPARLLGSCRDICEHRSTTQSCESRSRSRQRTWSPAEFLTLYSRIGVRILPSAQAVLLGRRTVGRLGPFMRASTLVPWLASLALLETACASTASGGCGCPRTPTKSHAPRRRILRWPLVIANIAAALALSCSSDAIAASWRSCPAFTTDDQGGHAVRLSNVETRGTTCAQARRVARSFYGQTIGSSGATYAAGFGCVYHGSSRVRCGSGVNGRGPRKIRWLERR